ncbi:4'-phosphopantetheinyl transferase family protein [Frankia sp. AgKG'84/4]|uniref:4'-phosphopantetheinyl transferase family protein n=1 Tax=Frankia sp. AgKG'84/4 TaxID=573490 RepID=UPI00200C7EE8|nr:4'-phosphopantetheinyl transferase superfamily protein [Frankia sp. AgKG'84/4]MCL9794975.1 4'-phosphopantetheinyl transferase superfamily protein [Frankia sp. AgKG'84/4]
MSLPARALPFVGARAVTCHVWLSRRLSCPERYLGLLDDAEQSRAAEFLREQELGLFVTGRVLARAALGLLAGIPASDVALHTRCPGCGGSHGKPTPVGAAAGWELSISHSVSLVAVAVTHGHPLGVDVERYVAPAEPGIPVEYEMVLTPAERSAVESLASDRQAGACLTLWTRKEAVLKATGEGLNRPMDSLTVSAAGQAPAVVGWADDEPGAHPRIALVELPRVDGCLGALAVQGADTAALILGSGADMLAERMR